MRGLRITRAAGGAPHPPAPPRGSRHALERDASLPAVPSAHGGPPAQAVSGPAVQAEAADAGAVLAPDTYGAQGGARDPSRLAVPHPARVPAGTRAAAVSRVSAEPRAGRPQRVRSPILAIGRPGGDHRVGAMVPVTDPAAARTIPAPSRAAPMARSPMLPARTYRRCSRSSLSAVVRLLRRSATD